MAATLAASRGGETGTQQHQQRRQQQQQQQQHWYLQLALPVDLQSEQLEAPADAEDGCGHTEGLPPSFARSSPSRWRRDVVTNKLLVLLSLLLFLFWAIASHTGVFAECLPRIADSTHDSQVFLVGLSSSRGSPMESTQEQQQQQQQHSTLGPLEKRLNVTSSFDADLLVHRAMKSAAQRVLQTLPANAAFFAQSKAAHNPQEERQRNEAACILGVVSASEATARAVANIISAADTCGKEAKLHSISGKGRQTACAANIEFVVLNFLSVASSLSRAVSTCAITSTNLDALCVSTSISTVKVIKTDCALDVLQAATILGQVGLALSNAIMNRCPPKTVPEFLAKLISTDVVDLMNQMSIAGCALDVSSVISGVGWAILYFSLIAVHCVKTVDMRALCAAGISGVTSSLASVAAVGSGLFLACRAGPQKESLLEPLADSIRRLEGRASLEKRQQQQRQQQQQQQQQQPPEEQQQQQQQEQQRLDELIPELRQQQQQRQQQQGLDELTAELTLGLSHRAGDEEQHQRQQQQPQQQPQQQQRQQQQQQQQQLDELFSAGDDPRAVWLQLGINLSDPKNRYNNSRNNNKNKSNSNINTSFLHNAPPALVGLEDIVSLLAAEVESQSSARESQRSAREVNNKNNNSNNNQVESQSSAREVNNNNNHYSSDDISNHNNHNNHNNNDNNNNIGLKLPTAPEKASVWWPRTCRR
ncbi:unnamed protein product [Polarella glacialis]|uniref:Uncharacterized protein n=1 Tax=Polarella glacialis TaxID=89957 RepID=A0A813LPX8_POLGL|nr:unnamed protein product [Polarella glacialis]